MHWIHMDPYMVQEQGLMNTGMKSSGSTKDRGSLYQPSDWYLLYSVKLTLTEKDKIQNIHCR
jgi:hypothetical protein